MSATGAGLLLVNLGTPDAPTTPAVRRYLREFLSDPLVIDLPALQRWLLVNCVIAPLRAPRSAAAYRLIWTEAGSPLLVYGEALRAALAQRLAQTPVHFAMRYGRPTIDAGLEHLRAAGCTRVVVFPLYPQETQSSTGSTRAAIADALARIRWPVDVSFVAPFFADQGFLDAEAVVAAPVLAELRPDHVLFSFHGLPERHIRKADASRTHCLTHATCCEPLRAVNAHCYRAQCFATARGIAQRLALADEAWSVAFQSRLGRTPWIQPFSDVVIERLPASGVRRLAVMCPAFVADCLETLEEIALRARAAFLAAGGEELRLVPSLNAHPAWVEACAALARHEL